MKKINLKAQRKELIKNRPMSAREIELKNAHWDARVILGSEDLIWRSEVIDDTDSLIKSLLDLAKSCIDLNIRLEDSKQLHAELSLHNDHYNIELETEKWLVFCTGLSESELADKAKIVEEKIKIYVVKYLNIGGKMENWDQVIKSFKNDNFDEFKILIEKLKDINELDEENEWPVTFDLCSYTASYDVSNKINYLELLVKKGGNLNFITSGGKTALNAVALQGNIPYAKLLLDLGADINLRKSEGHAATHSAIQTDSSEMLEFLLNQKGIDTAMMVHGDMSLMSFAKLKKSKKCIDILKKFKVK